MTVAAPILEVLDKTEVGEDTTGGKEAVYQWEQVYGEVDGHILKGACTNCEKPYGRNRDGSPRTKLPVMYVVCRNGGFVWWDIGCSKR